MSRRPDLFFVGHPRSGSGLLDSYLSGHPDIYMAKKELHYFGADLGYHDPPRSLENYLSYFKKAGRHKLVGEASTWYLISERAAAEIRAFQPEARILLLLRNPVSWLHSLHSHLVFSGDEDIADFGAALEAEPERAAGRLLPPHSIPRLALRYRAHVDYARQVQRYFDAFGRERVLVQILDDMQADPRGQYQRVLRFLGLPDSFPGMDEVLAASQRSRNSNRTIRSPYLRDQLIAPERRRVLEGVDRGLPGQQLLYRALRRANLVFAGREQMDPALKARLTREFAPKVAELEELLGRKLPWGARPLSG